MKKKDLVLTGLCWLFVTSLFIRAVPPAPVFATGLLVLYSFFYNSFAEKLRLLKERKYIWWMLGFGGFLLISAWMSHNPGDTTRALEKRLPLLFFPLAFGLIRITKELRNRILLGLAVITTAGCLASLGWAIHEYRQLNEPSWLYNDALSYFIGQQSIYTSLLVNSSIYIFIYFIFFTQTRQTARNWMGLAVLFLFIFSYLLASRNMMLFLYASVLVAAIYFIVKRRKYLEGVTLLFGLFIGVFLVFKFFPKTFNRFRELRYTKFEYTSRAAESHYGGVLTADQWNGANFRLAAWPCGWQVFKEHPVIGTGIGDKRDELFKVYKQRGFQFAIDTEKNVHNNYLDILFSTGIVGFLLFFLGWLLLPFIQVVRARDGLSLVIIITLALAMITEVYFDRGLGAMLFSFFIPFLLCPGIDTARSFEKDQ